MEAAPIALDLEVLAEHNLVDDPGDGHKDFDDLSPYDESSAFVDESAEGEAFKKEVLTNFNSRFNEGGVLFAAEYLMIALEPSMEEYGIRIQLNDESEETFENVNILKYFIF